MTAGPIFDGDGHVVEPDDTFSEYLPAEFARYVPRAERDGDRFRYVCGDRVGFDIHAHPDSVGAPGNTVGTADEPVMARGGADPAGRLLDMDIDGISVAAVYPTYGLMIQGVTDPRAATALCRAVNDWVADYCRHDPDRLVGVGTLPMTSAADALAEAERCVGDLGFRGVWRRPERFEGVAALQDPGHDSLFRFLTDADVPLAIHPGLNGVVPYEFFGDRFDSDYSAKHAAHFPVEQMMSLTSLVAFGILDRHPRLRVALLETGAVWLPGYAHRLDEHLDTFGFPARLSEKPSTLVRRQVFVSVEDVEPGLGSMLESYPGNVVFASDYPHGDGVFPGSTAELASTEAVTDEQRRHLFWGNACTLYGYQPSPDLALGAR